jgi:hypothetical protein
MRSDFARHVRAKRESCAPTSLDASGVLIVLGIIQNLCICHVERRDARKAASRSRNIPRMLAVKNADSGNSPQALSLFSQKRVTISDFGRTSRIGIVTTGCTGMFRLRRRMRSDSAQHDRGKRESCAPTPLNMTGVKCAPTSLNMTGLNGNASLRLRST